MIAQDHVKTPKNAQDQVRTSFLLTPKFAL